MLIIICLLSLIAILIARIMFENDIGWEPLQISIAGIAGVLAVIFCAFLIILHWNVFAIPKILLFISVCLYICFKEAEWVCIPFWIGILVTIIAYVISGVLYINNIEKCETPEVTVTTCTLLSANDNSAIEGSGSGNILYVHSSVSQESVYKYYYEVENGGIRLGTIPAEYTTLYFVDSGAQPYLETIVTTHYWINNNNAPATRLWGDSETVYKLYIPEGSVTQVYEFDAK